MLEPICLIVHRTMDGKIKYFVEKDFVTALAAQRVIILGATDIEFQKEMLTKEEIYNAAMEIKKHSQFRLANENEEVVLFYLPKRDKM